MPTISRQSWDTFQIYKWLGELLIYLMIWHARLFMHTRLAGMQLPQLRPGTPSVRLFRMAFRFSLNNRALRLKNLSSRRCFIRFALLVEISLPSQSLGRAHLRRLLCLLWRRFSAMPLHTSYAAAHSYMQFSCLALGITRSQLFGY